METLYNYSKYENIRVVGENIIFVYNDGLQNQSVYYIQKGITGTPEVLLDPNTLSDDGTVAINFNGHSKDNRYITYLQSSAGSDWQEIRIIDLNTLEVLEDKLDKFIASVGYNGVYTSESPDYVQAYVKERKQRGEK